MGDNYYGNVNKSDNNYGQINIASGNARIEAHQNLDNRSLTGIDLDALKKQLEVLKGNLAEQELYVEADQVKKAIEEKDESKIAGFLKNLGDKGLELANSVGLPLAVEAIKKALGV
jgi:hypothetical protein